MDHTCSVSVVPRFQAVEAVVSTLRVTPYRHDVIVTEDPGMDWQCRHTEHLHLWIQSQYH